MYPSRCRQTYVKGGLPFYLWLLTHLFVLDTPVWPNIVRHGKSSSVRLRIGSIGISPPPGTPQAAPFGYWSIIIPHVCHRPLPVVIRLHSKYRLIAPSLKGDLGAPFELGLFTPRKYNVGKVLDEWVFCFQRSLMRRVFYLAPSIGRQREGFFYTPSEIKFLIRFNFLQIFFWAIP